MSKPASHEPIRLALDITDRELLDRLKKLLSGVTGLLLVQSAEAADVVLAKVEPVLRQAPAEKDIQLTSRELEVLMLLAEGASNKAVAKRLGISVHTAKFHVRSLTDKLDAIGRTDAVVHAARRGVIHL